MATPKRPRRAAPPRPPQPPPVEAPPTGPDPDPDVFVVAGRTFRLGKMGIGPSIRFADWASKFIARGSVASRTLQGLEGPARDQAVAAMGLLTLLPESDLLELTAIALSNAEPVDSAWVTEHWDLEWVLPLLARWTEINPIGKYIGPLGRLIQNVMAQVRESPAGANGKPRLA